MGDNGEGLLISSGVADLILVKPELSLFGEFREVSGGDGGVRYSIVAGDIMVEVEEMVEVVVPGEQAPVASSEVV